MPFSYQPFVNPYGASIGELLAHRNDASAHAAEVIGAAHARAAELTGQAFGNAAATAGAAIGGALEREADPRRQLETIAVKDAQDRQRGNAAIDSLMKGDQLEPGAAGPRAESYLTTDGLFDVPKLNQALSGMGLAHAAPELLKGAEGINDSIVKHQQLELQASNQHTIMLGDLADGVTKMAKLGIPLSEAMDFVAQPALATKRIPPDEYAKVKQQILAMPPEGQQAALRSLMDEAAKLDKGETLAEGAQRIDRYGRVTATGAPKSKTRAELAASAATLGTPNETPTAARDAEALKLLAPPKSPLSLDEQLLTAKATGDKAAEARILDTFKDAAAAKRDPVAAAQLEAIRGLSQQEAQARLDDRDPTSPKNQQKLEQEYRTVLQRAMSSRSGGIGSEDAKVQQANHLLGMLDQFHDAKTGEFNIPRVQLNELALGLAKLTAGNSPAGEGMLKEFQQRTAKGDFAGALTYLTGQPIPANTQAITQMLKDSIERQGRIAEQNREGEMGYLRGLAPTDLAEERRKALEANSLNPLRQSRIAVNDKGEKRLFVSTDGGKTWK